MLWPQRCPRDIKKNHVLVVDEDFAQATDKLIVPQEHVGDFQFHQLRTGVRYHQQNFIDDFIETFILVSWLVFPFVERKVVEDYLNHVWDQRLQHYKALTAYLVV